MRPYAVFIHEQALAAVPKSGATMREVMAFIRRLADNPNTQGDFPEQDETGRVIQVKVVGRYASLSGPITPSAKSKSPTSNRRINRSWVLCA